jgi:phospholipid/cholesterol/gamma-HCH transport system substrate-binding protein
VGEATGGEPEDSGDAAGRPTREIDPKLTRGGLQISTKVKLILFTVITLLGISYVAAKYVGLTKYVTGDNGCTVHAEFPDSGGIFTNAEVTYRGVTVGTVGGLHVVEGGTRVDLDLDSCSSPSIPANSTANVADRSVVGEQYVDIVPPDGTKNGQGPYLHSGDAVGSMHANGIPTSTQELLVNLDQLVNSIDLKALHTTVTELGAAAAGRGNDLGRLIDATDAFITAASRTDNLNATIQLIEESSSVLQTQLDQRAPLTVWTHNLNLLAQQLKASDPDFRHLLNTGPSDLTTIIDFIKNNRTDLGVTLANLADVGDILVRHLNGIEQIFELYPLVAANGPTTLHDRGSALGLVLQVSPDPQDCGDPDHGGEGYGGTQRRYPDRLEPIAPNVAARCTASNTGPKGKSVRGSAHVPGGDPISVSGGGIAYPRAVTDNMLRVGPALPTTRTLGDASWVGLITAALH